MRKCKIWPRLVTKKKTRRSIQVQLFYGRPTELSIGGTTVRVRGSVSDWPMYRHRIFVSGFVRKPDNFDFKTYFVTYVQRKIVQRKIFHRNNITSRL